MKTLILWLDAFRMDYLGRSDTPFLDSLVKNFGAGSLKPVFGYSSVAASFYTGVYPNKHGCLTIYCRGSKPIRDPLLSIMPTKLGALYFNLRRYYMSRQDQIVPLVPYKYSKNFQLAQPKYFHHPKVLGINSIFDILREKGQTYLLYNWPLLIRNGHSSLTLTTKANDNDRTATFIKALAKDYDFYFMHLWDLDKYGHLFGPDSSELRNAIKNQDRLAREIIKNFNLDKDNIIIWSDHGMVTIKGAVNLQAKLPQPGQEYQYFLDSTLARFWFTTDAMRQEIVSQLQEIKEGYLLTAEDKRKFHLTFDHSKYGEQIFVAKPGNLILPNFFQSSMCKGMHGFDLSDEQELGIFILNRKCQSTGETVDLLPTILKMSDIHFDNGLDGEPLLAR